MGTGWVQVWVVYELMRETEGWDFRQLVRDILGYGVRIHWQGKRVNTESRRNPPEKAENDMQIHTQQYEHAAFVWYINHSHPTS